jgi:hypothetical protein
MLEMVRWIEPEFTKLANRFPSYPVPCEQRRGLDYWIDHAGRRRCKSKKYSMYFDVADIVNRPQRAKRTGQR